jgi:prepilin-type N-terminal cleavage/methylation domain-containing protein
MKNQKGFTLPELLITMGIIAILFGFVSINLIRLQRYSSLTTTVDTLVSDLNSQQNKAMTLDTEGRGTNDDYGIYFETSRYTLFHGSVYPPLDASNFIINLDPSLTFSSITFPSSSVIFSKGSGETGLVNGSNTTTLTDSTNGEQKIINVNKYGSITIQ